MAALKEQSLASSTPASPSPADKRLREERDDATNRLKKRDAEVERLQQAITKSRGEMEMSKTALTRAERAAKGRMEAEATCFGKEMGEMEMMYESAMAQATEAKDLLDEYKKENRSLRARVRDEGGNATQLAAPATPEAEREEMREAREAMIAASAEAVKLRAEQVTTQRGQGSLCLCGREGSIPRALARVASL